MSVLKLSAAISLSVTMGVYADNGPGEIEGGGIHAVTNGTGKDGQPTVEIRDGKKYIMYPELGRWSNFKLQVPDTRTTHPDAQWWPHAGLGLFFHWGIVSAYEDSSEAWMTRWNKYREENGLFTSAEVLWKEADTWNPENYDPYKWMKAAADAGFKYSVITTKHHDGYALWNSDHALLSTRKHMGDRDLIGSYSDACRQNDIKVGFYYSGMDWYFEREYMNFSVEAGFKVNYKGEKVDSLPEWPAGFKEEYDEYNKKQVLELIERYNPDIWWGDGGHGAHVNDIRKWRPGVVLNNRGETGGDHATAEGQHMAKPKYIKPVIENGWWWEVNSIATGGSWHYGPETERVHPSDRILMNLAEARCMGGNYLINIGPRPNGELPDQAYRLFSDMAEWMKTNKGSVFGIDGGGPWPETSNVPITCKGTTWYFHAMKNQATSENPIVVRNVTKPVSLINLRTGNSIPFTFENGTLKFSIPEVEKAMKVTDVIKAEFPDADVNKTKFTHW